MRNYLETLPDSYTITIKQNVLMREGYALQNFKIVQIQNAIASVEKSDEWFHSITIITR